MYIAAAEMLVKTDKTTLAGRYHDTLEPHLHRIPGFVAETRCKSVDVPYRTLILSRWEDAAALARWRNQSDHLRIQEKASSGVFQDYELRMGSAYAAHQDLTDDVSKQRCFMVLYWRQKQHEPTFSADRMSELEEGAVPSVEAMLLHSALYEDAASVMRLSAWSSQGDAVLYEESVVRVEGDSFDRICVDRNYTKERRDDAPHFQPGKLA